MSKVVLAVDDEPMVLDILAEMLEDVQCEVLRAQSATEALKLLQQHERIHAMITDVNMLGMDGYELVDRARALRPDMAAIVISGRPQDRMDVPMLAKPFTQGALLAIMEKTFGSCQQRSYR